LAFSCGRSSTDIVDVNIVLEDEQIKFFFEGLTKGTSTQVTQRTYLNTIPNTYFEETQRGDGEISIVLAMDIFEYQKLQTNNELPSSPLPDGRDLPETYQYFSGGDGVGNGRAPGDIAQFQDGRYGAVYQSKESFAIFYPYRLNLSPGSSIHGRLRGLKRKAYFTLVGEGKSGEPSGVFIIFPTLDL
jgi:hypothetical protein